MSSFETEKKRIEEKHKKDEIKKRVKEMFKQSEKALDEKLDILFLSGAIDIESWDENINPMLLPKAIMVAFLEQEAKQFLSPGTSIGKQVRKEANELKYHI